MDFSVGDFAEQLLAQEAAKGQGEVTAPSLNPTQSFHSADITQQALEIT